MSDTVIKLVPLREMPEESRLVVKCAADIEPENGLAVGGAIASRQVRAGRR